jgi:hypothetical protein
MLRLQESEDRRGQSGCGADHDGVFNPIRHRPSSRAYGPEGKPDRTGKHHHDKGQSDDYEIVVAVHCPSPRMLLLGRRGGRPRRSRVAELN